MKKEACIICGKEVDGKPIVEDYFIKALRSIKKVFTSEVNRYKLVVCDNCMKTYEERKKRYDSSLKTLFILFALFFLMIVVLPLFSGRLPDPIAIFMAFIISLLLVVLVHLGYMPQIER